MNIGILTVAKYLLHKTWNYSYYIKCKNKSNTFTYRLKSAQWEYLLSHGTHQIGSSDLHKCLLAKNLYSGISLNH